MSTAHTLAGDVTSASTTSDRRTSRTAGVIALVAPLVMVAGAAVWASSGTDLDAAVTDGTVGDYLAQVAAAPAPVYLHVLLWILGAPLLGLATLLLVRRHAMGGTHGTVATAAAHLGVATAVVCFSIWFALLELRGASGAEDLAHVLGFLASRIDWIATVLLIAVAPAAVSWAQGGRTWQRILSTLAAGLGIVALIGLLLQAEAAIAIGFVMVPVGLAWFVATGITELRN